MQNINPLGSKTPQKVDISAGKKTDLKPEMVRSEHISETVREEICKVNHS